MKCAQVLASFGANLRPTHERLSVCHDRMRTFLADAVNWSPLHHIEVLTPSRTRKLLRQGANVHMMPREGSNVTPLDRAEQLIDDGNGSDSARLVVLAAKPWSASSHDLFPDTERLQAAILVHSLYHVYLRNAANGGWQAVDFARHVLSFAVSRYKVG